MYKIGNSIDIHKLVKKEPLYVGGVLIPSKKGSLAYSDGDALLHSISEAILGALGKGDLGNNFPDTDIKYKKISSKHFITFAKELLDKEKYSISNIDVMIVLESPKLESYKNEIKENIASMLNIESSKINIKAGTNEKIGKIGNKRSYLVWSSVLIEKI